MSILPTWPIAAGALVAGLVGGAALERNIKNAEIARMVSQHAELARKAEVKRGDDERAARDREQKIVDAAGAAAKGKEIEIERINTRLAAASDRVQQRPDRKPTSPGAMPAAATACAGSTGAELSRPDGQFLVGEAARGDQLRAALEQCYAQYDGARALINAAP